MRNLGYLCSEFPALSHTFISREIDILEQEGFRIYTASINPVKDLEKMEEGDKRRAQTTYYVKGTPKGRMAAVFLAHIVKLPRFLNVLSYSLHLAWLSGPRSLKKALGYFAEAILVDDWARARELTHVHVHFANPAATVALIATRFGRLEFSLSVHGPDEFYDVERNNLRDKIAAAVFVRCIGYFCRSQLMRLSPPDQWNKFHVVRCGLFRNEFPSPSRIDGRVRNILCVGRVCPSKGQAVLVEAAKILRRKNLDFHLLMLGGGEDLETIRTLVARDGLTEVVHVEGPVGHERVREELARAAIFVLPSFAEGIPVALMEAMAAGVPAVSTRIAGIPELIEDGRDGFLVDASDVDGLAAVLEKLLLGKIDRESLRANAAAKIRSQYDVEENTRLLGALFESLGGIP